MISDLADAIDTLEVPVDGDALAAVLALRDRLEAKIVAAVCAFDDTNEWDTAEGCASLAAWLRVRGRMTAGDAGRLARTARRLRTLPTLREAWLDGTVSAALFMVLCLRDKGCRYPGCGRPAHLTDAHHIRHWIDHGETNEANLVLLCRRHHTVIHRPGWTIELQPDATVVLTHPDGRRRTSPPPNPDALRAA